MKKHPLADCDNCPLKGKKMAGTIGPANAKVAIVSRSPAKADTYSGKPFSSRAMSKILDHLLSENGYSKDDVRLTNVVLCTCDKVPKEAITACSARLQADLEGVDTVIAAGAEAASTIAKVTSIKEGRGIVHRRGNQRIIVTNNPAVVLHDSRGYPDLIRDFKLALSPIKEATLPEVQVTNDIREAKRWIRSLLQSGSKHGILSCDIESRGLTPDAPIVAFGVSADGGRAVSFGESPCSDKDFVRSYLRPFLEQPNVQYVWHNGKFDCKVLRWNGISARIHADTILLAYSLDERPGTHALEYLARTELGWPDYEPAIVKQFKKHSDERNSDGTWKYPVPDELYPYNALDCAAVALLYPTLLERAVADNVHGLYESLLLPSSEALIHVESSGVWYDINGACDILEDEVWPRLKELRLEMQMLLGDGAYNPNSTVMNSKYAYDIFHTIHAMQERKDKERSVDKSAYTELIAGRFHIVDPERRVILKADDPQYDKVKKWATRLRDFKELDKQRSTYLEGLATIAAKRPTPDGKRGKIYAAFNNVGTVSGRLSGSDPNLQNITRPKDGLPNIRRLILASDGSRKVSADYSQAELRTLAVFSGDPTFNRAYQEGLDIHAIAAERFYGANFTKEERSKAKNMNFGVAYGQSAGTFQEKHDIPEKEAAEFIKWWWQEFAAVSTWIDSVQKIALSNHEVVTPFGRKRRFELITNENRNEVLREAVNFMVQSTAHDFTLWSLIQLAAIANKTDFWNICIEGHDSLVSDVGEYEVEQVAVTVKETMESAPMTTLGWTLPFTVEVSVGPNWSDLEEIDVRETTTV